MEEGLERDQNGWFPADLMVLIANYVCVRTATAILLTNKYWNKIINPLLAHPAITIFRTGSYSRTLYHFRRGRGFYLWSKDKEHGVYPRERRQDSVAHIGYFKSLIEMRKFLGELKGLLTDPIFVEEFEHVTDLSFDFYAIMGNGVNDMKYYDMQVPIEADLEEIKRVKKRGSKIDFLLSNAGFINTYHDHWDEERIEIQIYHQMKNYSQTLEMTILADGDVLCNIHGKVFRSYRVRTSKKLFDNLLEIIKYSKHKRKLKKKEYTEDQKTIYSFNLAYTPASTSSDDDSDNYSDDDSSENGKDASKAYYIQHVVRRNLNTNRSAIETNGYKTGALEKIVKLLEDTLFNPKSKGPTLIKEKHVILPPQSKANALFDSVRFDPKLRSVGMPNIVSIVMNIEEYRINNTKIYTIALNRQKSLADLQATLQFLCLVEDALESSAQEKKIQNMKHAINSLYQITSMKIYTYSPIPIEEIPKSVLDLVAKYSLKYFPELNIAKDPQ